MNHPPDHQIHSNDGRESQWQHLPGQKKKKKTPKTHWAIELNGFVVIPGKAESLQTSLINISLNKEQIKLKIQPQEFLNVQVSIYNIIGE